MGIHLFSIYASGNAFIMAGLFVVMPTKENAGFSAGLKSKSAVMASFHALLRLFSSRIGSCVNTDGTHSTVPVCFTSDGLRFSLRRASTFCSMNFHTDIRPVQEPAPAHLMVCSGIPQAVRSPGSLVPAFLLSLCPGKANKTKHTEGIGKAHPTYSSIRFATGGSHDKIDGTVRTDDNSNGYSDGYAGLAGMDV